jgi:hypothetical protein
VIRIVSISGGRMLRTTSVWQQVRASSWWSTAIRHEGRRLHRNGQGRDVVLTFSNSLRLKQAPVSLARWQSERRVGACISISRRPGITSGIVPAGLVGILIRGALAATSSVPDQFVQGASTWSLIALQ